ncbi:MAG: SDR family NAD(P)-dependent oxidoreductase [Pyrinomonadaceae bacterium]
MSKSLLVLGARSDIGQAVAQEFARNGFDIILAARNIENLTPLRSDLAIRFQIKAYLAEFDAEHFDSHGEFYNSLPVKPDAVLCVFDYLGEQKKAETDWNETAKIVNVNYVGAVSILNIAANDFAARNQGTIIGISSVAGERGRQSNYIYGSAKGGFSIFLDGMRHRFANSNVNVILSSPDL